MIRFLYWLGFVNYTDAGRVIWPFSFDPPHIRRVMWRNMLHYKSLRRGCFPPVYIFRNLPGVKKWIPGRVLPRRWGFGFFGFEFGDRGHR